VPALLNHTAALQEFTDGGKRDRRPPARLQPSARGDGAGGVSGWRVAAAASFKGVLQNEDRNRTNY
jgi:hypothetical protein